MHSATIRVALAVAVAFTLATRADAQPASCRAGSFVAGTSTFHLDVNDNGSWDGDVGGDRTTQVAAILGPGVPLVGDWNGDGTDDVGVQVGSQFALDLDGDGAWEDAAGGDRVASFATSFGVGAAVVGDWNGDADDDIGLFFAAEGRFLLDANGNGVWDGTRGGDENVAVASWLVQVGTQTEAIVGDWNGDGRDDVGRRQGTLVLVDANGDHVWSGAAGGDLSRSFVPPRAGDLPFVGDFRGTGISQYGELRASTSTFLFDVNDDFRWTFWQRDVFVALAPFAGVGVPMICDWNGDGADEIAKVVSGARYQIDYDGDLHWLGPAGGDRSFTFDVGAPAAPVAGRWLSP